MSTVQTPNESVNWQEANVRVLSAYPNLYIDGFTGSYDLELFSRQMGAQIASVFMTGSTEAAETYLDSFIMWGDHIPGVQNARRASTVGKRFHDQFAALGHQPILGASQAVMYSHIIKNPDFLAMKRPEGARNRTWIDRASFATATEIMAEDETVTGYAGLKYTIALSLYSRKPSFTRTFATGLALSPTAEGLYPQTTTFAFGEDKQSLQ